MNTTKKLMTAMLASLMISGSALTLSPALASGGSAAGGGAAGGGAAGGGAAGGGKAGGKAGGGSATDGNNVVVALSNFGLSYNGKLPQGSVTLGYAADGTAQSMAFSLSNIKVPDGTVLPVRVITGDLQTIFTYYQISQVVYTEVDGTITISHSSASLTLNRLNGDVVPNFPSATPGSGTTEISILAPDGTTLLDGITGSFHA